MMRHYGALYGQSLSILLRIGMDRLEYQILRILTATAVHKFDTLSVLVICRPT